MPNLDNRTNRSSILGLPIDVIVQVLSRAQPQDIIHFSETCKAFNRASNERIVWINALKQFVFANGIFLPTFPLDKSAMTIREMKHAVTAPQRFHKVLTQKLTLNSVARPSSTRVLSIELPEEATHPDAIYLVPGGRFLCTVISPTLELWDLGFGAHAFVQVRPVASVKIGNDRAVDNLKVQMTADGMGLVLLIVTTSSVATTPTRDVRLEVYDIYPASENPVFRKLRQLTLPAAFHNRDRDISFDGSVIFIELSRRVAGGAPTARKVTVTAWNYVDDSWGSWDVKRSWGPIIPFGQEIISFDRFSERENAYRILISTLPPLQPRESDVIKEPPKIDVVCTHRVSLDSLFSTMVLVSQHQSFARAGNPHLPVQFDIVFLNPGTKTVVQFLIQPISQPYYPKCLPIRLSTTNLPDSFDYRADSICLFSARMNDAESSLQLIQIDSDGAVIAAVNNPDAVSSPLVVGTLWPAATDADDDVDDPLIPDFAFCPYSGRVCVYDQLVAHVAGHEIRIMDFLSER